MAFLNLGVVAHVDAGKTSLTERLLFAGGVIDDLGSVDGGSTRTDSLALERRRGITIKTAVASFPLGGVTVNLIDTPGHPDFIAEVERALRVLDGAVLVVSAVEGVQAQTRVLMRTLRRLGVPTVLFVNKIDRAGAQPERVLWEIGRRLTQDVVAMSSASGAGTPGAAARGLGTADPEHVGRLVEAAEDDEVLGAYVRGDGSLSYRKTRKMVGARCRAGELHPVFFGSAVTGAGVDLLMDGLVEFLPTAGGDPGKAARGLVFKVERDRGGSRVAYVRMVDGTLRVRDRVAVAGRDRLAVAGRDRVPAAGRDAVVTAIDGDDGARLREITAGGIGRVHGLHGVRIGDTVGSGGGDDAAPLFPPPTLSTVVEPLRAADRGALHAALTELAEQDPLIGLRADMSVSLYGEVQKEVIGTTLAEEYGIEVAFRGSATIHVDRPGGTGRAGRELGDVDNPHTATLELTVAPGDGFVVDVPIEQVPIHVYRTREFFYEALESAARQWLVEGAHGRRVIDVRITVCRTGFISPATTAGDFRKLMPLVLADALRDAGTVECEPIHRFRLDGPADALGAALGLLGGLGATPGAPEVGDDVFEVEGLIAAARLRELELALPGLTRGEGALESTFDGYRPAAR